MMQGIQGIQGVDFSGRYSITAFGGQWYVYIMHDLVTNYINDKGLKSRKSSELIGGFG